MKRIIDASLFRGRHNRFFVLCCPFIHNLIILRTGPFNHLGVADVDLCGIETQCVGAFGGGCLEPQGREGLPVNLNDGDVLLRHGGVEYGNAVEEDLVDQIDSCQCLLVVGDADGAGGEEVTVTSQSDLARLAEAALKYSHENSQDEPLGEEAYLRSGTTTTAVSSLNS